MITAHDRAKDLRRAANRLRSAIEPGAQRPDYDVVAAAGEIAETLGILKNVMRLLDDRFRAQPDKPAEFLRLASFYTDYHKVMR